MKIAYQVITKVAEDNEYSGFAYRRGKTIVVDETISRKTFDEKLKAKKLYTDVRIKGPFKIGEIVIIDPDTGREYDSPMRKADKWDVEYVTFTNIRKAIAKSRKVFEEYLNKKD